MYELLEKLALKAGLINYVEHETPRYYFVDGHADMENVQEFAELIVKECAKACETDIEKSFHPIHAMSTRYAQIIKDHFGVE